MPPQLKDWARRVMDRKVHTNPNLPYRKREPHQHNIPQLLALAKHLEAMPQREPFDVLAAIRNGDWVHTADPSQLSLETPEPSKTFRPTTPHDLKTHYDLLTSSRGKDMPFSDTEAVNGYFANISGSFSPFDAAPSTGNELSDLLSYIRDGKPKLVDGQFTLCNCLGKQVFGSRLEALEYLCLKTPFLLKAGPRDAATYMGLHEELTKEWKANQAVV